MKKVRITVMKKSVHQDLIDLYENPLKHACDLSVGQTFVSTDAKMPKGFCESAWQNLYPYVLALSHGGQNLFDGWMKNKNSAMVSCNDGFRPVSFYIEAEG